jgi:putative membrane protein
MAEIIDGRDLIGLTETELMLPIDEAARRMVLSAAKRVALVTTVSPRALVDVAFVAIQIVRLIRQLATLYAGRPGTLASSARAECHRPPRGDRRHAASDRSSADPRHGLAARLSARLGEGVINGLLTARVGIAAIEVCRPLPFVNGQPPRLGDVMAELRRMGTETKSSDGDS